MTQTYEMSAGHIAEAQTRRIEREFHCSRPRPRNRAMGFTGQDGPKRKSHDPWDVRDNDNERNKRR